MDILQTPRQRDAHKGDFGHVLVIGGNAGMSGAIRLAAEACARCGAGLVSVATHTIHANTLNIGRPELMVHAVTRATVLMPLLSRATVIVIGPGLGRDDWARQLLAVVLERDVPMVVDADALNLLSKAPLQRDNWILTPHPGEAGRLLQKSTESIQKERSAAVQALVEQYGGVAVLKGAASLIATQGKEIRSCKHGNPGMASGGMGDVLTGVIAALLAQGVTLFDAASAGVDLHARAADLCAQQYGERGLLASDLIPVIRQLVNGRV